VTSFRSARAPPPGHVRHGSHEDERWGCELGHRRDRKLQKHGAAAGGHCSIGQASSDGGGVRAARRTRLRAVRISSTRASTCRSNTARSGHPGRVAVEGAHDAGRSGPRMRGTCCGAWRRFGDVSGVCVATRCRCYARSQSERGRSGATSAQGLPSSRSPMTAGWA